jgi:hypothetical protein
MNNGTLEIGLLNPESATQAIRIVGDLANANGIDWAICGGIAMAIYGSERNTKDIDFIASKRLPIAKEEVIAYLKQGGEHFLTKTDKQNVKTDWILRNDNFKKYYEDALRKAVQINGFPVVTPEHLVLMKYIAGRFKDQEDAVFLLKTKDLINRRKIKEIVVRVDGQNAWTGIYIGLSRWFDLADNFIRQGDENESYRTEDEYLDS